MRDVSNLLRALRNLPSVGAPYLFFVEIPLADEGFFRLVHNTRHVEAGGLLWQACTIGIEIPREDADASLGAGSLVVPNVSRMPGAFIEVEGELVGQPIAIWLQHQSLLDTLDDELSWRLLCTGATITEKAVTLRIGHELRGRRLPTKSFDRTIFPQLSRRARF